MLLEKIRRRTTCSAALRWARWNVERVGISALLADRPSDAIRPQPYDLWNLYRTVRWRTPRVTMEFGVGCSTIAIAAALLGSPAVAFLDEGVPLAAGLALADPARRGRAAVLADEGEIALGHASRL